MIMVVDWIVSRLSIVQVRFIVRKVLLSPSGTDVTAEGSDGLVA